MLKINYIIKTYLAITALLLLGVLLFTPSETHALSGSEFDAGNIISDSVFFNGSVMSAQEIQNFLNAKVPSCDTNGSQIYSGSTTRASYGASRGNPAPYTCLKDYSQNVPDVINSGSDLCAGSIYGGTKTSAKIMYDVAQACGINPKVLLVLLQKEQSLVTDDWPWPVQYRSATGYGCPDTAPCDTEYYGFFNQVYQAAKAYKRYQANSTNYNYRAGRNNTILWNPNGACGSSNVYIQNQATAGLYIYTPYRPNQAALNNLYGTGDDCSSYGNRNFWRMYNDWFGNTYGPAFHATFQSQSPYPIIDYGNGISVYFQFKNTGTAFWKDDSSTFPGWMPIHLANTWPINRSSGFKASNWLSANRPTGFFSKVFEDDGVTLSADQHTVFPGQVARFEFTIYVDPRIPSGVYREYFQPILEGGTDYTWNLNGVAYLDIGVNKPDYKASFHSQGGYPTVSKGESTYTFVRFKNTGTSPWYDDTSIWPGKNPVHLATTWPINRGSVFSSKWPFMSRPTVKFHKVLLEDGVTLAPSQSTTQPGQIAEFVIPIDVPSSLTSDTYKEHFQPIAEGAPFNTWDLGIVSWTQITVQ